MVDLQRLSRILDDRPADQTITVEGGTPWLTLIEHLVPQRRRPTTLIGNPWATIAGTLAVGGFGDTSHIHGLSIANVTELVVVTPDSEVHTVGPTDALFRFVLAGRGQLGVIAAATLRTMRRPPTCVGRTVRWRNLATFLPDAQRIAAHRLYEMFRIGPDMESSLRGMRSGRIHGTNRRIAGGSIASRTPPGQSGVT